MPIRRSKNGCGHQAKNGCENSNHDAQGPRESQGIGCNLRCMENGLQITIPKELVESRVLSYKPSPPSNRNKRGGQIIGFTRPCRGGGSGRTAAVVPRVLSGNRALPRSRSSPVYGLAPSRRRERRVTPTVPFSGGPRHNSLRPFIAMRVVVCNPQVPQYR